MSRRHFPDNKIWANSPSEITDPTSALWANAYESGEGKAPPEAGVHNYIFNRSDEQHQHIEQNGIPRWLTDTEYADGGLALGSDNVIYQSQGAANQGNDPTTDDGTNWIPLPSVNLSFDPSGSTLSSENPEDAIKELDDKVEGITGFGSVIDAQTFGTPGSFTWNKPAEANADDTVVARIWGAGASGSAEESIGDGSFKSGGQGGAFVEVSFRATNTPSSATVTVGDGGNSVSASGGTITAGEDGGDSDVFGFTAKGGNASEDGSGLSQNGFTDDVTLIEWLRDLWAGGLPGPSDSDRDGRNAFYGGAGGASVADAAEGSGGASRYAGNGGDSDHTSGGTATAGDGQSPGGGGGAALVTDDGATANSGAGGDGLVEIYVIRGWSPSGITADIT